MLKILTRSKRSETVESSCSRPLASQSWATRTTLNKLEIICDPEDGDISVYRQGEFYDFCVGPHVPSTGRLGAFKLQSVAGAYWRGDENNPMLTRVYGTAWPTEKDLKAYLARLEEARERDHRKLGRELDLFSVSESVGPGLILWHPKGAM